MHLRDLQEMNSETLSRQADTLMCSSTATQAAASHLQRKKKKKNSSVWGPDEAFIPHMAVML